MPPSERDVRLADGRILRILEDGDPHGRPIFFLHGTPGSRLLYAKHVQDARRRGIRLIGHDRPGYGGSTAKPGRRLVDEAADVGAIADELGLDRFAIYGHSGGGAPTLACAARLPSRVVAAASLAGFAPFTAQGLDWLEGMGEASIAETKLMMSDQPAWETKTAAELPAAVNAPGNQLVEYWSTLFSDVDRAAIKGELGDYLLKQFREGLKPGVEGYLEDSLTQTNPWGFDPSAIRVPLQLWHGKQDKFAPFSHGRWLAAHLPGADAHLEPDEGHVTLFVRKIPLVHEWLVAHF
jgi:pimeloyl-ACP methyl ester carboxylesterase